MMAVIQANFGTEYAPEKLATLFEMMQEAKWTEDRFKRTAKYILKHNKYATWTFADWFDYGVKLYPADPWYLDQVNEFGKGVSKTIEWYRIDGKMFCRYSDGEELPFEKVE